MIGGSDGTHSLCSTELLDPLDGVWTPGPTLTTRRTNVAVATVGSRLYAVGGFSGMSITHDLLSFVFLCDINSIIINL